MVPAGRDLGTDTGRGTGDAARRGALAGCATLIGAARGAGTAFSKGAKPGAGTETLVPAGAGTAESLENAGANLGRAIVTKTPSRWCGAGKCKERAKREEREGLLFLKRKKQKDFHPLEPGPRPGRGGGWTFFGSFFQKRTCLPRLAFATRQILPGEIRRGDRVRARCRGARRGMEPATVPAHAHFHREHACRFSVPWPRR
jgi:hypothetical protein